MWTKSDVLALLQLLATIILATIQAVWCLTIRQGARLVLAPDSMLTALKSHFDVARAIQPTVAGMGVEARYKHSRSRSHEHCHSNSHCHASEIHWWVYSISDLL